MPVRRTTLRGASANTAAWLRIFPFDFKSSASGRLQLCTVCHICAAAER